jgi:hypothetical protein
VAGLAYPFGRPLGQPGDSAGQLSVLRACLRALELIDTPGGAVQLPFTWPEPPARARGSLKEPPPIARLLQRKPWLFVKFLAGDVPAQALDMRAPSCDRPVRAASASGYAEVAET